MLLILLFGGSVAWRANFPPRFGIHLQVREARGLARPGSRANVCTGGPVLCRYLADTMITRSGPGVVQEAANRCKCN